MDIATLAVITLVILLCINFFLGRKRVVDSIPRVAGGFPWVGNAFQVKGPLPLTLIKWAKEYGGLFIMKLFGEDIVVVSSDEAMKEGLVTSSTDFAGRPNIWRVLFVNDNKGQFGFGDCSSNFLKRKKTVMTILKRHQKELKKLEITGVDTVRELIGTFKSFDGKPFDPRDFVLRAVSSIMLSMLIGRSLSETEITRFVELDNLMGTLATGEKNIIFDIAPWTRFFLRDRYKELKQLREDWNEWLVGFINERKENIGTDNVECIIDNVLREINATPDGEGGYVFVEDDVFPIMRDLIIAGVDTSSSTLNAFLAVLAMNLECQKNIQKELDDYYAGEGAKLDDRHELHYTEAAILEILRYTSIGPFLIPHRAQVDTHLSGHKIPKDTTVWFLVFDLHHNEKFYSDPYCFKPERFLDQEGKLVSAEHVCRAQLYAFGAGRRICPGADFARNRIFLLITWLLQQFTFLPPEGEDINVDPRDFRMSSLPSHINRYKIRAIPRVK